MSDPLVMRIERYTPREVGPAPNVLIEGTCTAPAITSHIPCYVAPEPSGLTLLFAMIISLITLGRMRRKRVT